jgi:alanyl-tRNA synthetase
MTTNDIRRTFLDFFSANDHRIVPSSPLVPQNDPTLLFTNAGMVQFKDVFLGRDTRDYTRATSSQRCVRAGGKHNDLENVGYTARHHTFFEMLGNFSFGDYFKAEAIRLSWQLLTEELKLPEERLWITVYDDDDEAASIWLDGIGVAPERFARIGAKDNFWSMGDTGPCGPCSEIFYDHGPEVAGGPPGSPDAEGDRFVEIWNLVFMQFDRDARGNLKPLPKPSVDTGMGLERIAAVLQGMHDNYEIDLFRNLMVAAATVVGVDPASRDNSLKVIADHIRACAFLIIDGVLPANDGRGYVLRRIIRRAARHGHRLGATEPFLFRLFAAVEAEMGDAYPELARGREQAEQVLLQEEERFNETLAQGMSLLEASLAELAGTTIPGETVFKLYDTYGFPVDLTADIARERGLEIDAAGFEREMDAQRERARAASHFAGDYARLDVDSETAFTGYDTLAGSGTVVALFRGQDAVKTLGSGDEGVVVLDSTPFYAESGGQVGDQGRLQGEGGVFRVDDTQKHGRAHAHIGVVEQGEFKLGERVRAEVNAALRQATVLNHSATHLLHAALRELLGAHVVQKGSLVAPDRLRFDFSHSKPLTSDELRRIETRVNTEIRRNTAAETRLMDYDEAIDAGAMALFGEKYGDEVRVLRMGDFSTELCGGTHVRRTGDIGLFKIVAEVGIASGIRRIEALTGEAALARVEDDDAKLMATADVVRGSRETLIERTGALAERARKLEKEVAALKARLASREGGELAGKAVDIGGIKVLAARLDGADATTLRETADQLKNKLGSAAIVLAAADAGKVRLVAGVTKDRTGSVPAGELVNVVASQVGGRGGGRPDMAQAGGNDASRLDDALQSVHGWIEQRLSVNS